MAARFCCMRYHTGEIAVRLLFVAIVLCLAGCSGLYLGDNPGPDVSKERGPLTRPPPLQP